jgi:hypothetical protein
MKLGSNSVEDHTQLSHNRYPVDGALVGAGSLWPPMSTSTAPIWKPVMTQLWLIVTGFTQNLCKGKYHKYVDRSPVVTM